MTSEESPATRWSLAFLTQAAELGLRHVVVSPGSRSRALALAAFHLAQNTSFGLRVHVVIDERSAGFLGLGLAVESGQPVALVCTSGSAPAHYLPALVEAKHSGIPLLAVTADRPAELHGVGANQTTDQIGMFGSVVSRVLAIDAPEGTAGEGEQAKQAADLAMRSARSGSAGGRAGPVQVNVGFRDPLSSAITDLDNASSPDISATEPHQSAGEPPPTRSITLSAQPGTLVIAGHQAGPGAEELARALGAPLIAEVHSGAHFGPHLIVAYRELLDNPPEGLEIHRVVCVGRPTLSRQVAALLARGDIEQVVWQRGEPEPSTPSGKALVVDDIEVAAPASTEDAELWVRPWREASQAILRKRSTDHDAPAPDVALVTAGDMASRSEFARQEMNVLRRPLTRRHIALSVWEATWPHDHLVLASSRMIRELDAVASGKNIPVSSNRGLSGIDGTIATVRGIALARTEAGKTGVTRALIGDLAFYHDVGSLLLDIGEAEASRLQVIVVRDGGGSIFDQLEARDTTPSEAFDRVLFTPVTADISAVASAYGWHYRLAETEGDLAEALLDPLTPMIIDCSIARTEPTASSD